MVCANGFTDDHHHQLAIGIVLRNFCIRADGLKILGLAVKMIVDKLTHRIQIRQWIGIKTHRLVLARKRSDILIKRARTHRNQNQRQAHPFELQPKASPERRFFNILAQQPPRWQHTQKHKIRQKLRREQIQSLFGLSLNDILQHHLINHHIKRIHVIRHGRGQKQDKHSNRLERAAITKQTQ